MARKSSRQWKLERVVPRARWTLGDLLFMARHRERHFQETPALALNITVKSLEKYERAGHPNGVYPKFPVLVRLCQYYRVTSAEAFESIANDRTGLGNGGRA